MYPAFLSLDDGAYRASYFIYLFISDGFSHATFDVPFYFTLIIFIV